MRFASLVTSILVAMALYVFIMERDSVRAIFGGAATAQGTAGEPEAAERPLVSVVAMRSTAQEVQDGILLRGRTEAGRRLEVRAETTGLVVSEPLAAGTAVEPGDLMCELDLGTRGAQLAQARAQLSSARTEADAAATLARRGAGSENTAISRQAALEAAEAAVKAVEKDIERLKIHASFAGVLESDTAELGSLLQPGSICGTILSLDPIKLVGYAPETEIGKLQMGADAGARLIDGQEVTGQVTFLSRSADEATRTFRVEVTARNPDLTIPAGLTAEILVGLPGKIAHKLPQTALTLDDDGQLGIRAAEEDKAVFYPVTIIRDTPDGVWLDGLPETVDVIVVGQEYVADGRSIRVTMQEDLAQ